MKKSPCLLALGLALAACSASHAGDRRPAAARQNSTAIAVNGDYVYVVENGSVYKLSSRDLKPVASAQLRKAAPSAAKAASHRTVPLRSVTRPRPASRRTTWSRLGRRRQAARKKAIRYHHSSRPVAKEAPLPQ